ncbi:RNA ligase family protein [Deinococcus hopiensis]|uniref:RNA ligase n=1 Tax=Deinococcus hopiensis KR-140 TaxID=695939 RepID=A0A1W1VN79_9DEIO|nr:RNA ligase family protein [Deinococcus hopiensis]SMB94822.1 RNA ligase [Deinococcus hopiensis KR-140]
MRTEYPSTPHLPWSPGLQKDDRQIASLHDLVGREIVVTEKLDGENTTLYRGDLHARSPDTRPHPSRTWVKALRGRLRRELPEGWRLCGENVYAEHSLHYDDLEGHFELFSVWNERNVGLSWDEVRTWAEYLGWPTPYELYWGSWNEAVLRAIRVDTGRMEGYVVRGAGEVPYADFSTRVAKWVRPDHVQTERRWLTRPVVPHGLKGEERR